MRHSDHEQRQMDITSGEELDRRTERKAKRALTAPPDTRPRYWALRWHYACRCGWYALQSEYQEEPKRCPECGAEPK